jgi:hypothetical protein
MATSAMTGIEAQAMSSSATARRPAPIAWITAIAARPVIPASSNRASVVRRPMTQPPTAIPSSTTTNSG